MAQPIQMLSVEVVRLMDDVVIGHVIMDKEEWDEYVVGELWAFEREEDPELPNSEPPYCGMFGVWFRFDYEVAAESARWRFEPVSDEVEFDDETVIYLR